MYTFLTRFLIGVGSLLFLAFFFPLGNATVMARVESWAGHSFQTAALFFTPSITFNEIQEKYNASTINTPRAKKVKILIVPGHEPDKGGTVFGNVYERNVVVDIASALEMLFSQNPRFDAVVARTKNEWNPVLKNYFDTHELEITTFKESQIAQMREHIVNGSFQIDEDQVYHNTATKEASFKLYGINKWASDNDYDIVLHLHLNDYARRHASTVGTYDGFSIYVPDPQYSNAAVSRNIAEALAVRLNAYHATSTLPKENKGIVEDRELIAVGSNNSVDGAALLIEYSYIYEPQLRDTSIQPLAVTDYAYQTYLGIQDFFNDPIPSRYGSISFPYDWSKVEAAKGERGPGIYALQAALRFLGFYPPAGRNFSNCPVSGVSGFCTSQALREYQAARGIESVGVLGQKTRGALSEDLLPKR